MIQLQQLKHVHAARACFAHGGDCFKSVLLVCDVCSEKEDERNRTGNMTHARMKVRCTPRRRHGTQHGTWHGTHFSSCCLQLWECVKLVVQTVQENGFSPVCVRLCTVRPLAVVQRALQPT